MLNNILKITGILNNVFKPQKPLTKTRIKLYNTLTLPVFLYGSEIWTINPALVPWGLCYPSPL